MAEEKLTILFRTPKLERKANRLVRQFTAIKSFVIPKTTEEYWELLKERGLSKQYQIGTGRTFFPTEEGWTYFLQFCRALHEAEPFRSRSTPNDVFQNVNRAFARILTDGKLPENAEDVINSLPSEFVDDLTSRRERAFSILNGIELEGHSFFRVGKCFIGNFEAMSFDWCPEGRHTESTIEALNRVCEKNSAIIAGECIPGTSEFVEKENAFQCELALAILSVMLNMTYVRSFERLWQLRRVDRPEGGMSRHIEWNLTHYGPGSRRTMGSRTRFTAQRFKINDELVATFHNKLELDLLNWIVQGSPEIQSDLSARLINALFYFRQAATQVTPEMQISALWICVESFFTAGNEKVLETILPGLLGITIGTLNHEYWPSEAKSVDDMKKVFSRYYGHRSRTFHHGSRGHVSANDVQQFSFVVSNLIIGVTHLISHGYKTAEELLQGAKQYLEHAEAR
jgi:hypothetical protein